MARRVALVYNSKIIKLLVMLIYWLSNAWLEIEPNIGFCILYLRV